ncbi:MAG: hypothetical protein UT38_C0031G0003 [Microgenomates group bacterium GW2011_GWA2_39_19]|uniref:Uncharacterized protein n=1 Tax=Candidatus Blackburnbacteria bacterium RIFCSPLOWO2_01_FULL_40_20 TaxID=1797519 RepID=A0A1G1VD82_9BACT|nr:MAG: hypothetical protein UT38_C0031G0003 [Microgenomates group bacterium GW2011_GWA2_39_19]OGY13309.1 MAG: hypothetical protein A3A77_02680 [Candidatus Blackburnbacteria bacterium RIFCSPLOWO2_01_FULL_40_20]
MKEQLPKFLQYFYPIPSLISLIVGFIAFIVAIDASSKNNQPLFLTALIIAILSLVALIAKVIGDGKIKKLKLGINPSYLVKKHPHDLEAQISYLLNQKFELKDKTSDTAHLEKRPYFSVITAIVLFLLGVIPGILYLVWYFLQPKEMVYLDLAKQK